MGFNINEFRGIVNQVGVAKTNLFEAFIIPPADIGSGDRLRYQCESVSLPDLGINTEKVMPHGHGRGSMRPTSAEFSNLTCNFIVDNEFAAKEIFYSWMMYVTNYDNSSYSSRTNGLFAHEYGFMDEYGGGIEIRVYPDHKDDVTYEHRFGNAFPVNIGSIELAWANEAQIMVLPVTFAYNIYSNTTILPRQS